MKNQYRGWDCLRRVAWTVCKFKGGLGKKHGVVFLRGVDTPMDTILKQCPLSIPPSTAKGSQTVKKMFMIHQILQMSAYS